jgi:hypothetical protein
MNRQRLLLSLLCIVLPGALPITGVAATADDVAAWERVERERKEMDAGARAIFQKQVSVAVKANDEAKAEEARLFTVPKHGMAFEKTLSVPRLRRSYTDLLSTETGADIGGLVEGQAAALKDTKGANFAYTDDFKTKEETWTTEAALMLPFVWKGGGRLRTAGIMPSVTLNRFTTNAVPKDAAALAGIKAREVDDLTYRLTFFGNIRVVDNLHVVVRGSGAWVTDTGHEKEAPLLELEVEPIFQLPAPYAWIGTGYMGVPEWAKKDGWNADTAKAAKKTYLAYTARVRGRAMWTQVRNDGNGVEGPELSRAGVTADLHCEPFILERLSAWVGWTYLAPLHGNVEEEQYFEAGAGVTLYDDEAKQRKVAAELKYEWGAKDYLGTPVNDKLTLAISVLY